MADTYPQEADLQAMIESVGVIDPSCRGFGLIDLGRKLASAIGTWEKRTGWTPFLAARDGAGNPVETTRPFDAPDGRILQLRGGLLSCSSVTVFGSEFVIGQDCYLQPADAPSKGRPYTEIRFMSWISSRVPQCVAVTGVWGRCLDLADVGDAWEAIIGAAFALCVPLIALNISEGRYEYKAGDETFRFSGSGTSPLSAEKAMLESAFDQAAKDNKRTTV